MKMRKLVLLTAQRSHPLVIHSSSGSEGHGASEGQTQGKEAKGKKEGSKGGREGGREEGRK